MLRVLEVLGAGRFLGVSSGSPGALETTRTETVLDILRLAMMVYVEFMWLVLSPTLRDPIWGLGG